MKLFPHHIQAEGKWAHCWSLLWGFHEALLLPYTEDHSEHGTATLINSCAVKAVSSTYELTCVCDCGVDGVLELADDSLATACPAGCNLTLVYTRIADADSTVSEHSAVQVCSLCCNTNLILFLFYQHKDLWRVQERWDPCKIWRKHDQLCLAVQVKMCWSVSFSKSFLLLSQGVDELQPCLRIQTVSCQLLLFKKQRT